MGRKPRSESSRDFYRNLGELLRSRPGAEKNRIEGMDRAIIFNFGTPVEQMMFNFYLMNKYALESINRMFDEN